MLWLAGLLVSPASSFVFGDTFSWEFQRFPGISQYQIKQHQNRVSEGPEQQGEDLCSGGSFWFSESTNSSRLHSVKVKSRFRGP